MVFVIYYTLCKHNVHPKYVGGDSIDGGVCYDKTRSDIFTLIHCMCKQLMVQPHTHVEAAGFTHCTAHLCLTINLLFWDIGLLRVFLHLLPR